MAYCVLIGCQQMPRFPYLVRRLNRQPAGPRTLTTASRSGGARMTSLASSSSTHCRLRASSAQSSGVRPAALAGNGAAVAELSCPRSVRRSSTRPVVMALGDERGD